MGSKQKSVASLLSVLIATASPYSAPLQAQGSSSCAQEIDRIERETQAFDREVRAQNLEFLKNDVKDAALRVIRTRLAGNPTSDALFDLKDKKEQFDSWTELVRESRTTLEELLKCMETRGCRVTDFLKRQNEALKRWIQSLGIESLRDEELKVAAERVKKAASLIQGYASRTLSMAQNSALSAVNNCLAQFERSVIAASPTGTLPLPPSPPTPAKPTPPGDTAVSQLAIITGVVVGGAALVGAAAAAGGGSSGSGGSASSGFTCASNDLACRNSSSGAIACCPRIPGGFVGLCPSGTSCQSFAPFTSNTCPDGSRVVNCCAGNVQCW